MNTVDSGYKNTGYKNVSVIRTPDIRISVIRTFSSTPDALLISDPPIHILPVYLYLVFLPRSSPAACPADPNTACSPSQCKLPTTCHPLQSAARLLPLPSRRPVSRPLSPYPPTVAFEKPRIPHTTAKSKISYNRTRSVRITSISLPVPTGSQ